MLQEDIKKCTKALSHRRKVAALHKTKFTRKRYIKSVKKNSKLVKKHKRFYKRAVTRRARNIRKVKRLEKRCLGI